MIGIDGIEAKRANARREPSGDHAGANSSLVGVLVKLRSFTTVASHDPNIALNRLRRGARERNLTRVGRPHGEKVMTAAGG